MRRKKSISPDWPNALNKYERFFSSIRMGTKTWLNQNTIPKPIDSFYIVNRDKLYRLMNIMF